MVIVMIVRMMMMRLITNNMLAEYEKKIFPSAFGFDFLLSFLVLFTLICYAKLLLLAVATLILTCEVVLLRILLQSWRLLMASPDTLYY